MTYIRFPIESNPTTLAQEVFEYIQTRAPYWTPVDGNLDVWIIRAVTQLASENRDIAGDVQDDIFRWFGASLMGIPPGAAVSAHTFSTWTLLDSLGHTIPQGTAVGIRDSIGQLIPFRVAYDVTVPNGNTATNAGEVTLRAIQPGSDANALGGAGYIAELIDVTDWVQTVVLTAATTGGLNEEDDPTYLSRLVTEISRLSKRPILAPDFAALAVDAHFEVFRALAIDNYNPVNQTYGNERMVTVAPVREDGTPVSAAAKTEVDDLLQANREVNFIVHVIDPTYTTINVTTTVIAMTGYTFADVQAAVDAAIRNYLSPANWGMSGSVWTDSPILYYNEMITEISNVQGVARLTALTLNGTTGNVTLSTPASLTQPGTVAVTVT